VLGNALSVVADDSFFDEAAQLIRRREYGRAREMLVLGLVRLRDPRVASLLVEMLDDDDVVAHAVMALGRLRPPGVRPLVEPLVDHPSALVRGEAKKALRRLPGE
jgi:HEAT repeat protein